MVNPETDTLSPTMLNEILLKIAFSPVNLIARSTIKVDTLRFSKVPSNTNSSEVTLLNKVPDPSSK